MFRQAFAASARTLSTASTGLSPPCMGCVNDRSTTRDSENDPFSRTTRRGREPMAPRPIWSGTISFGLVSIPVRMLTATSSRELRFHFVDRHDLEPIGYDKVRKDTGEHVDPDDVVRAFELEKGRFVPIDPEDLDRLDVELTHSVDICDFVSLDEIDPIYFRQAYYLVAQEGGEKPYRLLVEALEETRRLGIAKVGIRQQEDLPSLAP